MVPYASTAIEKAGPEDPERALEITDKTQPRGALRRSSSAERQQPVALHFDYFMRLMVTGSV